MGKSSFQAAKAARYASKDGGDEEGQEFRPFSDGMADVTYHTPAWHQARIESLMKPRPSYEEWKAKAKEAEGKLASVAEQEEARMREYRAQLDADRALRMGHKGGGTAAADKDKKKKKRSKDSKSSKSKQKHSKKDGKHKKKHKKESSKHKKKRKRSHGSDSSSSSPSGSDSSGSSADSSSDSGGSSGDEGGGTKKKSKRSEDDPVKLSDFFKS